jgi:tRNA nucleotidyltransferase (CCA-adding enzyme)
MPTLFEMIDATNEIVESSAAGGPVRNFVMDPTASPDDWDFTTPVKPDEVTRIVRAAGRKANPINKDVGTILFKVPVNGEFVPVEMTTYRAEKYEKGSRRPSVEFITSLHDDLARRDFTINAMAMGADHKVVDPFGGRKDLEDGIIRAVGSPRLRFEEDIIRVLRGYRFVARFGFAVEERTRAWMAKSVHRIVEQPKERWLKELDKMLVHPHIGVALRMMWEDGAFRFILPELHVQFDYDQHSPYHAFPLHEHTARVVEATEPDIDLRWAALLHDVGKPTSMTRKASGQQNYIHHAVIGAELVEGIAQRMRWPKKRREFVVDTVRNHLEDDSPLKAADSGAQKA